MISAIPKPAPSSPPLKATYLLLILAVMMIWGTDFVVMKYALVAMPLLLMAALRFTLAAFPLVFIWPRSQVPWRNLVFYGVAIGAGQFGLFTLTRHISPSLASLVAQAQVFCTVALAIIGAGKQPYRYQLVAPSQELPSSPAIAITKPRHWACC